MQAIFDKSSNYSRNYTCRYHPFCSEYHDAKYNSFCGSFTRIICTPRSRASNTSVRAYSRCHELVGPGYTKCSFTPEFRYPKIRHRSGSVISPKRGPTTSHSTYVSFPEAREMEQEIYHLTFIRSNFHV